MEKQLHKIIQNQFNATQVIAHRFKLAREELIEDVEFAKRHIGYMRDKPGLKFLLNKAMKEMEKFINKFDVELNIQNTKMVEIQENYLKIIGRKKMRRHSV